MIYIIICQQTDTNCCIYKTIGFRFTESRTICPTLIFIFMVLFSILQVEKKMEPLSHPNVHFFVCGFLSHFN